MRTLAVLAVTAIAVWDVAALDLGPSADEQPTRVAGRVVSADGQRLAVTINEFRVERGLPPLVLDDTLTAKAMLWAGEMAAGRWVAHSDLAQGAPTGWQRLGENVGAGPTLEDVQRGFEASPTHRANLADPEFTHVGVGVVAEASGDLYVATEFMR